MKRLGLLVLVLAVTAAVVSTWRYRDELQLQWDCFLVTGAKSYPRFRQEIARFLKQRPDETARMALTARWQTGNERFDEHLARYMDDSQCSEDLREAFSLELSARRLLQAWAGAWKAQHDDWEEEANSVTRYLEALYAAEPQRTLTWREVLEFQALLVLRGQDELAHRLTPNNWRLRYERWQSAPARSDMGEKPGTSEKKRAQPGLLWRYALQKGMPLK